MYSNTEGVLFPIVCGGGQQYLEVVGISFDPNHSKVPRMFLGLAPNRRAPKASVFTLLKKNRLLVPGLWPGARTGYHTLNSAWQLKGSKKVLGAGMEVMKRGAMRKLEVLEERLGLVSSGLAGGLWRRG